MRAEGLSETVIKTFEAYFTRLEKGETGKISKKEIVPPSEKNCIDYDQIRSSHDTSALKHTAIIKLNGGLGTSMGLSKAKSLLPVKGNMNFLDIITRQVLTLRAQTGFDIPLIFMNSFNTEADTLGYLEKYPDLQKQDFPLSFVQNKFPRIRQSDLKPFESQNRNAMWNPPGHGDLYTAITSTGLLEQLIDKGYRYVFVSNSDNLGATPEPSIPAFMEENRISFLMEVCIRTQADKKGGHLSEDRDGRLLLREVAQCPEDETAQFQDINYYKYFNTNNLWIDLKALHWEIVSNGGMLLLPLIINPKVVDETPVYQLETAMGAAIGSFSNSKALIVPRQRFAPVKKTSDLLAIWSDAYEINEQYQVVLKRGLQKSPVINLENDYYLNIDQMLQRFSDGVPSLVGCSNFSIEGDVSFGNDVICEGEVRIRAAQASYIKNRLLTGEIEL